MAHTCIYTLEPLQHGGVIAKVREVAALHRRYDHEVRLLYTATEQAPSGDRRALLRYFVRARPHWETSCGFSGFAIPHWPLPLWLTYALPLGLARSVISRSQMHVVVSGSNHCGLPAALLRKRYIVWIGTLYEEELAGKAAAGDAWARRVLRGPARLLLGWEERLIFERAMLVLTNGAHTAAAVRQAYPAVADRVRVLIYPVDTDVFCPDPAARERHDRPYLLFTARINDSRKNVGLLFRAFARVRTVRPDIRLVLTGNAPDEAVNRALAAAGVQDAVEFVGYQPQESLVRLYQGAELFVLASSQEGLGISILEALACGLPVVSTRCGGPESVIREGETGVLVRNDDAEALADGVLRLLSAPVQLDAMRTRCAQFARATFSKERIEGELLAAFRMVYPGYFAE